ncbi:uncharacterized protein PG998_007615 [Apiospora kogelbergensis]
MSRAPSTAPSKAPSQTPSRAPSQSPLSLAETSAPPRSPNYEKPSVASIAEVVGSIDASPNPSTLVPSSRGLDLKTSAPTDNRADPSHAPSRAPTSSSPRAPTVAASRAPTMHPPTAAGAGSRYPESMGGASTLAQTPSQPSTSTLLARCGTEIPPPQTAPGVDPTAAPTIIPTASGVPIASKWTSAADIEAATRQANYATLGAEERRRQDRWAKRKADEFAPCPANFAWTRHDTRKLFVP